MVFRAMGGTGWAPVLSLPEAVAHPVAGEPAQTFQLEATIVQSNKPFRLLLQLLIRMEGDREHLLTLPLRSLRETISITLPARPITIDLDPEFMTVRRIARQRCRRCSLTMSPIGADRS